MNTPTQLLFALEASSSLGVAFADLTIVVVPTPGARESELYGNLLDASGAKDVLWLGPGSLTRAGRVKDVGRLLQAIPRQAHVVTSMLNYLPARALISRAGNRSVIIDDGSWTLHFAELRRTQGYRARTPLHAVVPFGRVPAALTFFTIYDTLQAGDRDTVTINHLAWTASRFGGGTRGEHMAVLGSDLVRAGYISEELYRARLAALRYTHPGWAEYWPHRREDLPLAERLCSDLDMELRARRLPLEAEILSCDPAPAVIATLPSTATTTLRLLRQRVGYRVIVSVPPEESVAPARRAAYAGMAASAAADADEVMG